MTTEDRAYEAAARALHPEYNLDTLPADLRSDMIARAKRVVTAFLTAMGQEVQ